LPGGAESDEQIQHKWFRASLYYRTWRLSPSFTGNYNGTSGTDFVLSHE